MQIVITLLLILITSDTNFFHRARWYLFLLLSVISLLMIINEYAFLGVWVSFEPSSKKKLLWLHTFKPILMPNFVQGLFEPSFKLKFQWLVRSLETGPKSNLTLFSCAINQILENEPDLFLYEVRNNILVSCSKSAKSCSYTLFKTKLLHAHKRRSSSASYHCSIGPNFLGFGNTS